MGTDQNPEDSTIDFASLAAEAQEALAKSDRGSDPDEIGKHIDELREKYLFPLQNLLESQALNTAERAECEGLIGEIKTRVKRLAETVNTLRSRVQRVLQTPKVKRVVNPPKISDDMKFKQCVTAADRAMNELAELFHSEQAKKRNEIFLVAVEAAYLIRAANSFPGQQSKRYQYLVDAADEIINCNSDGDRDGLYAVAQRLGETIAWIRVWGPLRQKR